LGVEREVGSPISPPAAVGNAPKGTPETRVAWESFPPPVDANPKQFAGQLFHGRDY